MRKNGAAGKTTKANGKPKKKAPRSIRTNAFIDNGIEGIIRKTSANFNVLAKFALVKLVKQFNEHPEYADEIKAML
jgi:hypothetical protein